MGPTGAVLFGVIVDPAAILEMDPGGTIRVVEANPAMGSSLGRSPKELAGRDVSELYDVPAAAVLRERVRSALARRKPVSYQVSRELPTGPFVELGTVAPLSDDRVLLIEHDRSAESSAFRDLHQLERLTETGTWSLNLDTGGLWRSREFQRITGRAGDPTADARESLALVHPEDRARVEQAVQEVLQTGDPREVAARLVRDGEQPHGEQRHVVGRLSRADDLDGRPVRV